MRYKLHFRYYWIDSEETYRSRKHDEDHKCWLKFFSLILTLLHFFFLGLFFNSWSYQNTHSFYDARSEFFFLYLGLLQSWSRCFISTPGCGISNYSYCIVCTINLYTNSDYIAIDNPKYIQIQILCSKFWTHRNRLYCLTKEWAFFRVYLHC